MNDKKKKIDIPNGVVILVLLVVFVVGVLVGESSILDGYENHIQSQEDKINQLRIEKDSLQIKRAEIDQILRLLNNE